MAAPGRLGRKATIGYGVSVASWEQEKQATVASWRMEMGRRLGLIFLCLPRHSWRYPSGSGKVSAAAGLAWCLVLGCQV